MVFPCCFYPLLWNPWERNLLPSATKTHPTLCNHTTVNIHSLSSLHPGKTKFLYSSSRSQFGTVMQKTEVHISQQKQVLQGLVKYKLHYQLPLNDIHNRDRNIRIKANHFGSSIAIFFFLSSVLCQVEWFLYTKRKHIYPMAFSVLCHWISHQFISSIKDVNYKFERLQWLFIHAAVWTFLLRLTHHYTYLNTGN